MTGVSINTQFNLGAPLPIDSRFVLTKSQMLNMSDDTMPAVYGTWCSDDNQFYIYVKNTEEISPVTGKFSLFKSDEPIQYTVLPEASDKTLGKVYQYIGNSTDDFVFGMFYTCVLVDSEYKWKLINNGDEFARNLANTAIAVGTKATNIAEEALSLGKSTEEVATEALLNTEINANHINDAINLASTGIHMARENETAINNIEIPQPVPVSEIIELID